MESKLLTKSQYRIGLIGSAGTGKSSLAVALSKKFEMPFLASKEITLDILRKDGYDYASGIQVERFLAQGGRQDMIFKRTVGIQKKHESFVTDRTVIDVVAYVIAELHACDPEKVTKMMTECQEQVRMYTHLIFCPWGVQPIGNNKLRTLNPWYQFVIHSLGLSILNSWGVDYYVLQESDTENRAEEVLKYVL